ncbi:MAG: isoprenylcysteine carboxylmethyltransferase family protein [bacterium]
MESTGNNKEVLLSRGLDFQGVRYILRELLQILVHFTVLLVSAREFGWANAWLVLGLALLLIILQAAVLQRYNPGLINRRGKVIQKETKGFDKVFVALYIPLALLVSLVCGLDAGGYGWSAVPPAVVAAGVLLYMLSWALGLWAMAVNRHFEATVIIRDKESHRVCSAGPYKWIRHPGYAAAVSGTVSYPLVLGSWRGLAVSMVLILLFIVRTGFEDKALLRELEGYRPYAADTRYRLLPRVW